MSERIEYETDDGEIYVDKKSYEDLERQLKEAKDKLQNPAAHDLLDKQSLQQQLKEAQDVVKYLSAERDIARDFHKQSDCPKCKHQEQITELQQQLAEAKLCPNGKDHSKEYCNPCTDYRINREYELCIVKNNEIESLQQQLQKAKITIDYNYKEAEKVPKLLAELQAANKQSQIIQEQYNIVSDKRDELEAQIEGYKPIFEKYQDTIKMLNSELTQLRQERDELKLYADKLAQGLPEGMLPKDIELLRSENDTLREQVAIDIKREDELNNEIRTLRAELYEKEFHRSINEKAMIKYQGEIDTLRAKCEELLKKVDYYQGDATAEHARVQELKKALKLILVTSTAKMMVHIAKRALDGGKGDWFAESLKDSVKQADKLEQWKQIRRDNDGGKE